MAALTGEKCEHNLCQNEAQFFAVLTDSNQDVLARRPFCEIHAQEMFSIRVDFNERLSRRVEAVKRRQENGPDYYPNGQPPHS